MHFVSEASKHAKHRSLMPTEVEPIVVNPRMHQSFVYLKQHIKLSSISLLLIHL